MMRLIKTSYTIETVWYHRPLYDPGANPLPTLLIKQNIMSLVVRKAFFCICENKDADQLRGNREADQRLCFALHR